MHKVHLQVFYKPSDTRILKIPTCTILSTIKAKIGDKSSMPNGGNIFLNGAKNISVISFSSLRGCAYQLMLGSHVKNILISINNISKSNNLYIAIETPILHLLY